MLRLVLSLALAVGVCVATPSNYWNPQLQYQGYQRYTPGYPVLRTTGVVSAPLLAAPLVVPRGNLVQADPSTIEGVTLVLPLVKQLNAILSDLVASSSPQERADLQRAALLMTPAQQNVMEAMRTWRNSVTAHDGVNNIFLKVGSAFAREMVARQDVPIMAVAIYNLNIPFSDPRSMYHNVWLRSSPDMRASMAVAKNDMRSWVNLCFKAGFDSWNALSQADRQFLQNMYDARLEGLVNKMSAAGKAFFLNLNDAELAAFIKTGIHMPASFDYGVIGANAMSRFASGQLSTAAFPQGFSLLDFFDL